MAEKGQEAGLYIFPDDLKVYKEISSDEETDDLQKKIGKMYDWKQWSLLKFHPLKCNVLRLSSNKKSLGSAYYSIVDRRMSAVTKIDDLGITFKEHLSFEKADKANSLADVIRSSFIYFDK